MFAAVVMYWPDAHILFGGLVFAAIIVILLTKPFYDGGFR